MEGSTVSANQALLSDLEVLDGGYLAMSGRINGAATPIIGNKSPQAGRALPYLHWHYAPTVAHSQEDPVWKSFPVTSVTLCKVSCVEDISLEHNCIQSYILCTLVINSNGQ